MARTMRTYGMSLPDVLAMPMRAFWYLSGIVPRLMADEQKQLLEIQSHAQNGQAANELHKALSQLSPDPVQVSVQHRIEQSAVRDEEGFALLKAMAR